MSNPIPPPTPPPASSQAIDVVSQSLLDDLQRQYLQTRHKIEAFSYYGRNKIEQLERALQERHEQFKQSQQQHDSTLQTLQRVRDERDTARREVRCVSLHVKCSV